MPTYSFKLKDGSIVDEFFPMAQCPKIGTRRKLKNGKIGTRIFEVAASDQVYVQPDLGHRMLHYPNKGSSLMKGLPEPPARDAKGHAYCPASDIQKHEYRMAKAGFPTHYERPSFGRRK